MDYCVSQEPARRDHKTPGQNFPVAMVLPVPPFLHGYTSCTNFLWLLIMPLLTVSAMCNICGSGSFLRGSWCLGALVFTPVRLQLAAMVLSVFICFHLWFHHERKAAS